MISILGTIVLFILTRLLPHHLLIRSGWLIVLVIVQIIVVDFNVLLFSVLVSRWSRSRSGSKSGSRSLPLRLNMTISHCFHFFGCISTLKSPLVEFLMFESIFMRSRIQLILLLAINLVTQTISLWINLTSRILLRWYLLVRSHATAAIFNESLLVTISISGAIGNRGLTSFLIWLCSRLILAIAILLLQIIIIVIISLLIRILAMPSLIG